MNGSPASPISPKDQNDVHISLDEFRAQVAGLTFLDTFCAPQCPLLAAALNEPAWEAGPARPRHSFLLVRRTQPLTKRPWDDGPRPCTSLAA
jgi:hypothetical protein